MARCRPLSHEEQRAVIEAVGACPRTGLRNRALVTVGLATGLRISELLSLTLGDVVEFGEIRTHVTVRAAARKGQENRRRSHTVKLSARAREALEAWVAALNRAGYEHRRVPLWLAEHGRRPMRAISRAQAWRIMQGAKVRLRLHGTIGTHSWRKSKCGQAIAMGRRLARGDEDPMRIAQEVLGHASIESTMAYAPVRREVVEAVMAEEEL